MSKPIPTTKEGEATEERKQSDLTRPLFFARKSCTAPVPLAKAADVLSEIHQAFRTGWGKKLTYCIGFARDHVVDVTRRYTKEFEKAWGMQCMFSQRTIRTSGVLVHLQNIPRGIRCRNFFLVELRVKKRFVGQWFRCPSCTPRAFCCSHQGLDFTKGSSEVKLPTWTDAETIARTVREAKESEKRGSVERRSDKRKSQKKERRSNSARK